MYDPVHFVIFLYILSEKFMEVLEAAFLSFLSWVVCAPNFVYFFFFWAKYDLHSVFIHCGYNFLSSMHYLVKKEMKCLLFF